MRWLAVTSTCWANSLAVGGEDDGGLEVDGIFARCVERDRDNGALGEGLRVAFGLPLLIQGEDELALEEAVAVYLAGQAETDGAFGGEERRLGVEEVNGADDEGGGVALRIVEDCGGDEDVGVDAAEDLFCGFKRLAALELLDDEGVAGFGHGAGAPVAADEEGVLVEPGYVLFGFGEGEAVGTKAAVRRSNSRRVTASSPPAERPARQMLSPG